MDVHECVSFILVKHNKVLLEKRSMSKKTDPGLITIPGGHIEAGESQEQTLYRELKEELDIVPNSFYFLCSLYHPTVELQLIHYYIVESWSGEIKSLEADDVNWYKMDGTLELVEADDIAINEYGRVFKSFNN